MGSRKPLPPCPYEAHRKFDWKMPEDWPDGTPKVTCGRCHPPSYPDEFETFDPYTGHRRHWKLRWRNGSRPPELVGSEKRTEEET